MRCFGIIAIALLGGCNAILDLHEFSAGGDGGVGSDAVTNDSIGNDAPGESWLDGYAHRKAIVFAPRGAALPAFVAAVQRVDQDVADGARADGGDLLITDGGSNPLPTELVSFDASIGAYEIWVQIDLGTAPTNAYLYWGNPTASMRRSPWGSAAGVWHMTAGASLRDSGPHGHDASSTAPGNVPATSAGIVGVARQFDGIDDSMSVNDPSDGSLDFGVTSFTYSLWVDPMANLGAFDMPLTKGGTSSGTAGYDIELGSGAWNAGTSDGGGNYDLTPIAPQGSLNQWSHIAVVVDRVGTEVRVYRDGAQAAEASISGTGSFSGNSALRFASTTYPYDGVIDEVRIYPSAIGAQAIRAEYDNAILSATFFTIGALETAP